MELKQLDITPIYKITIDSNYTALQSFLYGYIRMLWRIEIDWYTDFYSLVWDKAEDIYKSLIFLKDKEAINIVAKDEGWYTITYNDKIKKRTKRKKESIKEEVDVKNKWTSNEELRKNIVSLITQMKEYCNSIWVLYDNKDDWRFAKFLLTTKAVGEAVDKWGEWNRLDFALFILKQSNKMEYCKKCYWPLDVYYSYQNIYNKWLSEKDREERVKEKTVFTFTNE